MITCKPVFCSERFLFASFFNHFTETLLNVSDDVAYLDLDVFVFGVTHTYVIVSIDLVFDFLKISQVLTDLADYMGTSHYALYSLLQPHYELARSSSGLLPLFTTDRR